MVKLFGFLEKLEKLINPIRDGGVFNTKTLKMASKWPQISWLFLFLYDLSEKQKTNLGVFHSDFGCLEGGGGEHPPLPLNVYFQPRPK